MTSMDEQDQEQAVVAEMRQMHDGHNPIRCQKMLDAMVVAGDGDITVGDVFMLSAMLLAKGLSMSLSPQWPPQIAAVERHAAQKLQELVRERTATAEAIAGIGGGLPN